MTASQESQNPSKPTLDYGTRPPLAWVTRHQTLLIYLSVIIAVGGFVHLFWQPLKHRALWIYWSRQAAAHVMPAKAIDLFVEDSATAKSACAAIPDYSLYSWPGIDGTLQNYARYLPVSYLELLKRDPRLKAIPLDSAVAFMGTLRRPDGTPRLVVIGGCDGTTKNILEPIWVRVLPLPGWFDALPTAPAPIKPPSPPFSPFRGSTQLVGVTATTRLKSGVSDPLDLSHIVFEFVILQLDSLRSTEVGRSTQANPRGVIDAYLQYDESITFKLRNATDISGILNLGTTSISGK